MAHAILSQQQAEFAAPAEASYLNLPSEPISLSQSDYNSLDDFVQTLILGFPSHEQAPPQPQLQVQSHVATQPTSSIGDLWDVLEAPRGQQPVVNNWDALLPQDAYMQQTQLSYAEEFSGDLQDVPMQIPSLGQFTFGQNLPAAFQPDTFLPASASMYNSSSVLGPVDQGTIDQIDMAFIDYSAHGDNHVPVDLQSIASSHSTPPPMTPQYQQQQQQQQQVHYMPPASAAVNRRRVGGSWRPPQPEFVVGSSRQPSLYP